MRVLLLEGELGASCDAALQLAEAGHTVARCHSQDEASFPCRGLSAHVCPLDEGDVDAVVVVRAGEAPEGPEREFGEDGARCALRRHIPLVLAGETGRSPLGAFAAAISEADGLVDVVEKAAHAPLRQHEATARVAFATVLEAHGLDSRIAEVEVTRDAGRLHVTLVPTAPVPTAVLEMASVRVAGAIRAVDRTPRVIDVVTAAG